MRAPFFSKTKNQPAHAILLNFQVVTVPRNSKTA